MDRGSLDIPPVMGIIALANLCKKWERLMGCPCPRQNRGVMM
jgi:hypothetical protein